jgi:hypothetical protein
MRIADNTQSASAHLFMNKAIVLAVRRCVVTADR